MDVAAAELPRPLITVEGRYKEVIVRLTYSTIRPYLAYKIFYRRHVTGQNAKYSSQDVPADTLTQSLVNLDHLTGYQIFVKAISGNITKDSKVVKVSTTGKKSFLQKKSLVTS